MAHSKVEWLQFLSETRDLRKVFYEREFDKDFCNDLVIRAAVKNFNKEALHHGVQVATKISCRYPLVRMAAVLHDLGISLECSYNKKNHNDVGSNIAHYYLTEVSSGWSKKEVKTISALILVHNYNLFNKMAKWKKQPIAQWRRAILHASKLFCCFDYKDLARLAVADMFDPRQQKYGGKRTKYWALKEILNYFKRYRIVRSTHDLDFDVIEVLLENNSSFELRDISKLKKYLLNYVVQNGYEYNNEQDLADEANVWIATVYNKCDKRDSRVIDIFSHYN